MEDGSFNPRKVEQLCPSGQAGSSELQRKLSIGCPEVLEIHLSENKLEKFQFLSM